MTRGFHSYPTLFTNNIQGYFPNVQVGYSWQNVPKSSPSKSLNFIRHRQLPNTPPERNHVLGRRALSLLIINHGLPNNSIGTVNRKSTHWSRSLDQPISRQQQTKGNGENSLNIKRKETSWMISNFQVAVSRSMRVETMASSRKK